MKDFDVIKKDFLDCEPPITITKVEPMETEHYYKVFGKKADDKDFETEVFVNGNMVLPLPK